ncbi:MAG TPA: hypothetical protein PLW31_09555 [Bacteroidales bacterium]|nr:hypothetical protein [Bacteroidales bacterium]HOX78276.1 hypothetical protein [Bacteroidales bacterium]HPI85427.1 hypothetical protein [Bacteroidales bacterium]
MARITRKWENGYVNPDWAESERISRRLASKITLAANAFYLTFGFIFFFFINLQAPQIYAGPVLPHLKSGTENLITIDGHVTHMIQGQPSNYHPPTDVLFYYPGETEPFDQTQTDPNGDYTSTMNYVTVSENNELVKGMKVLGNPYTDKAKLEIGIQEAGKYSINVYDASTGKLLLSQDSELPESNTNISLSGLGSAGVKIVSVTNGEDIYTAKLVQVYSNQFSPDIAINSTPIERNNLKSLEFLTDSLVIRFVTSNSYPEYYTLEKTVEAVTSTVDATMQQMPVTYDFLAYGYNINEGESVGNNASLKVTWGDGTSNIYTSDSEGRIHILRENTLDTARNIFIENADTTYFQEWIFGVKQENLITTKEKNLFQSQKEQSGAPGTSYVAPTPAPANLTMFPDTFEVYFVSKIVYDSEGQAHNTRGEVFRTVVSCRSNPDLTKKWEIGQNVTTYLYEMQTYESKKNAIDPKTFDLGKYLEEQFSNRETLEYITPEQSALQSQALDSLIAQGFYLRQNGRQLFPEFERVLVYDGTEPEYLEGQARGWDQTHFSQYGNNNENGCVFTSDFTFSDYYRFKGAIANYTSTSNMSYKMDELIGSFTHSRDPPNGNLSGKVTFTDGHLTSFGNGVIHVIYIADPGTIFW